MDFNEIQQSKLFGRHSCKFYKLLLFLRYNIKMYKPSAEVVQISPQALQAILNQISPESPGKNINWTTDYRVELPIRMNISGPGSEPPITVSEAFTRTALSHGNYPSLTCRKNGVWVTKTYAEYYNDSINFGKALISKGIPISSTLNIIGFNSPQWCISFMGSILGGYLPIGVYTTNGAQACGYIAKHSECKVVVVENQIHLQKYIQILNEIPLVQYFIIYDGKVPNNLHPQLKGKVFDWAQWLNIGSKFQTTKIEDDIKHRIKQQKPGKCCTFIYTSGTTGPPKAVMLSHDNYTWLCKGLKDMFELSQGKERIISILPLSHVAAQLIDIVAPAYDAIQTYFVDVSALQGNLTMFLNEIKPTVFMSVPRLWEKIFDKIDLMINTSTGIKKKLFNWARSIGKQGTYAELTGKPTPFGWSIAKSLIYNKIKSTLGIDKCRLMIVSAAPLQPSIREFFMQLNIPLRNCFGMSQLAGPETFTNFNNWDSFDKSYFKEAGERMPGLKIKIDNPDQDGNGQICLFGRNVFMGYFKDEAETRKSIDSEGYLRSGDIGRLDARGNLFITGRLKELLITAGGQNVAPVLIEQQISKQLPEMQYLIVIGDQRKYLSLLMVLKTENGNLSQDVKHVLKEIGSSAKTVQQVRLCPIYLKRVQQGINKANSRAISKAQNISKFHILNDEFSMANGVLTPTLKVKRKEVSKKFSKQIQSMYKEPKL